MLGRSVLSPAERLLCCQRRLRASPPSMAASLEPVVEHPVASSTLGEFQRRLSMLTQRISSSAVWGYSSLSIMFLSKVSAISFSASGSMCVVTNVARFRRALPSSMSSSWTIWYAMSGAIGPSGRRCLGTDLPSPSSSGLTERYCPSRSSPAGFVCNGIAVLLSGNSSSGEDEHDEYYVDDDVHQPAVGVHPVAHLGHGLLGAPAEQQVRERRKRRYEDRREDERQGAKKRRIALREVHPYGHQDDEIGREYREQQEPGQERRPWLRVLHGAEPARRFARRAGQVAPDGQDHEQADQRVLDDVAERTGVRGVAERDAAAQRAGEGERDRDAHGHGDHHASYEVGRELQRLG